MPGKRDEPLLREIGRRIAKVRRAKGMTQEKLAESVGLEPTTISRQETGHRSMSISTLALVAKELGVGVGDLLDSRRPLPEPQMDADTEELLKLFDALPPERKGLILKMARELVGG